ncbi:hypothetical protein AB0I27_15730 [Streptomyces sp. NPDC050597]|uniref:hypothetical protein n=1 Tax=Streptomyces sp. NPDC050597 TaxID=3157212 RepID=UPI00341B8DAE
MRQCYETITRWIVCSQSQGPVSHDGPADARAAAVRRPSGGRTAAVEQSDDGGTATGRQPDHGRTATGARPDLGAIA